jgi:hypothetical protein
MKRLASCVIAVLVAAVILSPAPAGAQTETRVTAGAAGVFPNGATFNAISLNGLRVGIGVIISSTGSAQGQFQATLLGTTALGQPQAIGIGGKATAGSAGAAGAASFSGTCSIDMGDGSPLLQNVPFVAAVTTDAGGHGTLGLVLGATSLPAATINQGSVTIE